MKIYLDVIFLINLFFDFLIVLVVDIVLKRKAKLWRITLSSIVGSLSIFFLFININSLTLFLLKVIISIFMLLIAFSFKNIKSFFNNFIFLYVISILLGGFLYYLNVTFSYKQEGLIFFYDKMSINYIFLIIVSPIILYIYIKQNKKLKLNYNNHYSVSITFKDNKSLVINAFLDSGNYLKDPITNKRIIIVEDKLIDDGYKEKLYLVPYKTLNHKNLLSCISIKEIEVIGYGKSKNVLLGLSKESFGIDGVVGILNNQILEELK